MFKKISPFLIATLIAGIIVSCGSSNPFIDKAKSGVTSQNYQAALEAAEQSIQNRPDDPLGYYYKGVALGELANNKDISARKDYYEKMNKAFSTAQTMADSMEKAPEEIERIDAVKVSLWRTEHNKAIEYATDDSLKKVTNQPLKLAISHLENATTIIPDSTLSWSVLAQVNYMDNNIPGAIDAMKGYMDRVDDPKAEDYLQFSSYYRLNKEPEKAVEVLEEGQEKYPKNEDLVKNLADTYMNAGHIDQAIATVERLIKSNPKNPQYHLVLGTQIYQSVAKLNDSLKTNNEQLFELQKQAKNSSSNSGNGQQKINQLKQQNDQMQQKVDRLTKRATNELNTVLKYRPNDAVAYNTLGIIYQNKAAALFEKRNEEVSDNQKAAQFDKQAKDVLKQSMQYYEKATQLDPDNKDYWKSLYKIYVTLGMDQKAEEAQKKAGM